MQFSRDRFVRMAACAALIAVLTASCGDVDTRTATTASTTMSTQNPTTSAPPAPMSSARPHAPRSPHVQARAAALKRWLETIAWNRAAHTETAVKSRGKSGAGSFSPAAAAVSVSIADVMQCIKEHESGDYTEHSHTSDGSGAFQVIPSTWAAWSARAGYPGYAFAYLAPPAVQDAVIVYMLTNGGAGNWSMRYGDDPCTVGMGG